ncbi:hypothetical protein ACFSQT_07810 [Mesorhizobium calcicola]|uniref:Uncharacterized protein n=1 Tax=Mesorhizobium calcicola TaxID=1300310 RepID=A0ABW4WC70_9HYPH
MFPKNSGYVATATDPKAFPQIDALIYAAKGRKRNEQGLAHATDARRPTGPCFQGENCRRSRVPKPGAPTLSAIGQTIS